MLSLQDQITGSDYINASFIDVSNTVCTSGALHDTLLHCDICRVMKRLEHILLHRVQSMTLLMISGG